MNKWRGKLQYSVQTCPNVALPTADT
jgi:hypothetical protein